MTWDPNVGETHPYTRRTMAEGWGQEEADHYFEAGVNEAHLAMQKLRQALELIRLSTCYCEEGRRMPFVGDSFTVAQANVITARIRDLMGDISEALP